MHLKEASSKFKSTHLNSAELYLYKITLLFYSRLVGFPVDGVLRRCEPSLFVLALYREFEVDGERGCMKAAIC